MSEVDDAPCYAACKDNFTAERAAMESANAPINHALNNRQQMHPHLSDADIARITPYGSERTWRAGETVVRPGDPAIGMLLVLEGRVRIMQPDGIGDSALVTEHGPGNFSADIGHLSGMPEMVDAVAVEDVRAIVVRPACLRALMVAEAMLGEMIMQALLLRRAGLIQRGRGPTLIGHGSDPALLDLQAFLRRQNYPYSLLDIDVDAGAAATLGKFEASPSDLPLVICPNGSVLRRPDIKQVLGCLGLLPEIDATLVYDVAIIGAGPAGLAAAVYAASEGLRVIVLDALSPGGQAGASARIENYLGFPTGISGQALAGRAYVQAQKFGVEMLIPAQAQSLDCAAKAIKGELHVKLTDGRTLRAKTVVVASGARYRRPEVPRLAEFEGRGVWYWASALEAKMCSQTEVVLVGGGNSAGQAAVFLSQHAAKVNMLVRGPSLAASMSRYLIDRIDATPNIELLPQTEVVKLHGDGNAGLNAVTWRNRQRGTEHDAEVRNVFLFVGADPETAWLDSCGVALDAHGFVRTGESVTCKHSDYKPAPLETNIPGLFAVGDVRSGSVKRVGGAIGEGAAAVAMIHQHLAAMERATATA